MKIRDEYWRVSKTEFVTLGPKKFDVKGPRYIFGFISHDSFNITVNY